MIGMDTKPLIINNTASDWMMKDDMIFIPYKVNSDDEPDGYQCKIKTPKGVISVRYKGHALMANEGEPYEVWYPTDGTPTGYQTANDIFNYINYSYDGH